MSLNLIIVSAYVAIAILAPTPWIMFGGFLVLAVLIRCATLCWGAISVGRETTVSRKATFGIVGLNLVLGLTFSAALLASLWWLGRFWLSGVKIIVPLIAVFVAYKSTFPLAPSQPKPTTNEVL